MGERFQPIKRSAPLDGGENIGAISTPWKKARFGINGIQPASLTLNNVRSDLQPRFQMKAPDASAPSSLSMGFSPSVTNLGNTMIYQGYDNFTNSRVVLFRMSSGTVPNAGLDQFQQVIITRKVDIKLNERTMVHPHASIHEDSWRYDMFNIVAWNYQQHLSERIKGYKSSPRNTDPIPDADAVWKKWWLDGIASNEQDGTPIPYIAGAGIKKTQRFKGINLCISGRATVLNIWGGNLRKGTKLYLILKKVYRSSGEYVLGDSRDTVKRVNISSDFDTKGDDVSTCLPFQLVPYAHYKYTTPPLEEIIYKDENGIKCIGRVIYVGKSNTNVVGANVKSDEVCTDFSRILTCGSIEIFFNA